MKTKELNLFIVAENALVVNGLKHYLQNRFGSTLNITCFFDNKTLLKNISETTHAVILDNYSEGKKGTDVLRAINMINPAVAGIFHTSASEVGASVQSFLAGEMKLQPQKKFTFKFDEQYSHYYARA